MPVKPRKSIRDLLAEANAEVETISAIDARSLQDDPNVVFVDIRDIRELEREGGIPNAFHAPRGMLEFWVDPESPYYKDIFGSGKKFLFF
jgi:rhodanese-related sulfurtransferase